VNTLDDVDLVCEQSQIKTVLLFLYLYKYYSTPNAFFFLFFWGGDGSI
jgi:hypothetical protein